MARQGPIIIQISNISVFFTWLSHDDHLFTRRPRLNSHLFQYLYSRGEILENCRLLETFDPSKQNRQRTHKSICYSPGLVFHSPQRDCALAVCFPEAAATFVCTLCTWPTCDTPTRWSGICKISLYSVCHAAAFDWPYCRSSAGEKD